MSTIAMNCSRPEFARSRTELRVIDSHTGGEPTRVVVEGAPDLGNADMRRRRDLLRDQWDWLRTSLVTEPRGAAWMVGAVVLPPYNPDCTAGVVFFNNVGYLGMCGHGLIGVVATLSYLGKVRPGRLRIETPVGEVAVRLADDGWVSFENVASYRLHKGIELETADYGKLVGDVAWGGNWFFLAEVDECWMQSSLEQLASLARQIRAAIAERGLTGADGAEIDHIELFGNPSASHKADSRSFVLCPGGQYDRSPCGTGTSAKIACLAADGILAPDEIWRQESMIGSVFSATYQPTDRDGLVVPTISGRAFVNADLRIVIDPEDPFCVGIPSDLAR